MTTSATPAVLIEAIDGGDYRAVWQAMRRYVQLRDTLSADRIWWLEHPPVFTLGQAGRHHHLLNPGAIPIVEIDRGGQVTYHGPGQLVIYPQIDLRRAGLGVRALVSLLEHSIIELLSEYAIEAYARADAPGVYVGDAKIAALGLRVSRGCSYHGLALNVDMDLSAYDRINPCGYPGMSVVDMAHCQVEADVETVARRLIAILVRRLGYHRLCDYGPVRRPPT